MNVLHINNYHYLRGGSEAMYFRTAEILERYGQKAIYFSMSHPNNLSCDMENYFVPCIDFNSINWGKTAVRILYSFEAKKCISNLLDKYHVDIAHMHNVYHEISPSIIHVLKKRRIPMVMTLHDYKMVCASYTMLANNKPCEDCSGGRYYLALKNRCTKGSFAKSTLATLEMYLHQKLFDIYTNVNTFISPSIFLKNKLQEMGFKKRIVHLPNFIDIEKYKQIEGDEMNDRENSIVYFGRLTPEKGITTLLNAMKMLQDKDSVKAKVKIIGDGPVKNQLCEKITTEKIKNIQFPGYMKSEALYKEIKNCMFVVLPSEWYENNPMSILEAFSFNKPVIGSRIGGIPELIKDNVTGLTFEPGNAEDLTEKIKYMLNNPDEVLRMGKNARTFVKRELNAEKYYQALIKIYQSVITQQLNSNFDIKEQLSFSQAN